MIRYAGPVIDTHHHIWMRKDVAWLKDPPIRRAIGDFFGLRRDIPVEEWMHDAVPEGVVKSVHVTANWGAARALDETRWLQGIADQHGFPHGIVAQADLTDPDIAAQLKAQRAFREPARRAPPAALGQRPVAPERQPAGSVQHAGIPPRLRAPGTARPAFRTAGVRRAGAVCGRADQGVSRGPLHPVACRHADRPHAGRDRAMARRARRRSRHFPTCMSRFPASTCSTRTGP